MAVGRMIIRGLVGVAMVGGNGRQEEGSNICATIAGSALHRESVLIYQ